MMLTAESGIKAMVGERGGQVGRVGGEASGRLAGFTESGGSGKQPQKDRTKAGGVRIDC